MKELFLEMSPAMIVAAISAFFGGIVASWVSRVNEKARRNHELWKGHREALIKLEFQLNGLLPAISGNRRTANGVVAALSRRGSGIPLVWMLPHALHFDDTLLIQLLRVQLANETFDYGVYARWINHDIDMVNQAYSEMRSGRLRKDVTNEEYLTGLTEFQGNMKKLWDDHGLMHERTLKLQALTRVALARDRTHNEGRFHRLPKLADISRDEIDAELRNVKGEIAARHSRS